MVDRDAFLKTIIERPSEDGPRLVFADWLEEQDDADRAEFIRVQCRLNFLVEHKYGYTADDSDEMAALRKRERELFPAAKAAIDVVGFPNEILIHTAQWSRGFISQWSRGFISELVCTLEQWAGGQCQRCDGRGWRTERVYHGPTNDPEWSLSSSKCNCIEGRVPGLAASMYWHPSVTVEFPMTAQPIETVRLVGPITVTVMDLMARWPGVKFEFEGAANNEVIDTTNLTSSGYREYVRR